jgi:hypothetical protein
MPMAFIINDSYNIISRRISNVGIIFTQTHTDRCFFPPSLTLIFCKGGAMSQSADTADANADEYVAVVLELLCFLCPPTIVDEQFKVHVIVSVLI